MAAVRRGITEMTFSILPDNFNAALAEVKAGRAKIAEQAAEIEDLKEGDEILKCIAEEIDHIKYVGTYADGVIELHQQLTAEQHKVKVLVDALERFIDSHEECTDFDGFTAQITSMEDYHEAQEALATVKGE